MTNPILEYWSKIESGQIVVSDKVRRVYAKLVQDLNDTGSEWEFRPKRARHAIDFIERYCRHSKGAQGGKPFRLELWQKALVAALFGFVHKIDGTRKYRELILIVARKNGKSTLGAAIALYMLAADGEPGPEVVSAATKRDQAKIIWSESKRMVRKSPVLRKRIKTLVGELVYEDNDGSFKPLSSDSNTLDGLNIHCALIDELHAIEDKNLYDVIVDGMSAREQPLSIITTTAGTVREGIFDLKYDEAESIIRGYGDPQGYRDERVLPIIYELDRRDEWTEEAAWYKANPGLGTIKSLDELRRKVAKAKANPMLVSNLLTKDFNIRETTSGAWLSFEQIDNRATFDLAGLRGSYAVSGTDLSSTTDLSCATLLIMKPDGIKYAIQQYFLPEDLVEHRVREDKIPYDRWAERGLLTLCPGNKVDYSMVTAWYVRMINDYDIRPLWNGYDPWNSSYWVQEMQERGFEMEIVRQGARTLSQPMKEMGADLGAKRINYNNNPILKWCLTNTEIKRDENDNIRPVKGPSPRRRIDGTVSLLIAYTVLFNHLNDYKALI